MKLDADWSKAEKGPLAFAEAVAAFLTYVALGTCWAELELLPRLFLSMIPPVLLMLVAWQYGRKRHLRALVNMAWIMVVAVVTMAVLVVAGGYVASTFASADPLSAEVCGFGLLFALAVFLYVMRSEIRALFKRKRRR